MAWWQRIRIISAIALTVSLVIIVLISSHHTLVICLGIVICIGCVGIFAARKAELIKAKKAEEQRIIQLMSHYRHDWMNDLQLLFGYVSLKKYDKLSDCLDKIRCKAMKENSIAKLGIPSLVAYFISFRLKENALALELEMEQDINLAALPMDTEKVSQLVQGIVDLFHVNSAPSEELINVLSVQFALEDNALLVDLDYQGGYHQAELKKAIHTLISAFPKDFADLEEEYTQDKAVVTLQLPFRK